MLAYARICGPVSMRYRLIIFNMDTDTNEYMVVCQLQIRLVSCCF